jgi:hypothetical protein
LASNALRYIPADFASFSVHAAQKKISGGARKKRRIIRDENRTDPIEVIIHLSAFIFQR